jgi:site-specific recombinase XerD
VAACTGREFDDLRDEAIIREMFDTGTRLGELAGIQLDDWDTRQDFLLVDGKSGPRLVPMSASTAEALGRYVRRARNRHAHADLPALWLGRRGALTARGIARMLDRRCDQAGVGHINPYRTTGAAWPATSTPWPTASSRWLPARWAAASSPA